MSSSSVPHASGLPVLPPIYQYTPIQLPEGKVKSQQNALQGSATPAPGATSLYDIVV